MAKVVIDDNERRQIFTEFVDDLNQSVNPACIRQPTFVEDWIADSPLVEIVFAGSARPRHDAATQRLASPLSVT